MNNESTYDRMYTKSTGSAALAAGTLAPEFSLRSTPDQFVSLSGYLGIMIQPVTSKLANAFKLQEQSGALIGEVTPKSPAEEAGLKEGDVIMEFNGRSVVDSLHLRLMVPRTPPGTRVSLEVIRDGKEKTFDVKLAELPPERLVEAAQSHDNSAGTRWGVLDGVEVTGLDATARHQLNTPDYVRGGALVANVDTGSSAAAAR